MGLKSVSGINRVTIKKGKAVTAILFSSSSVSMIPMCGNPPEPRTPTLSSASPTSTAWEEPAKTKSTNSATPSPPLAPLTPRPRQQPPLLLPRSNRLRPRIFPKKDSPPRTLRWSWNTQSAQRPQPLRPLERPTTTPSTPSWRCRCD